MNFQLMLKNLKKNKNFWWYNIYYDIKEYIDISIFIKNYTKNILKNLQSHKLLVIIYEIDLSIID